MLQQIADVLLGLLDSIGYLGIFIATVIESFFAPIPSEIILVTAGFYAQAQGSFIQVILISIIAAFGAFIGTLPFYLISRYSADNLLPRFLKRWGVFLLITPNDLEKAQLLFEKRGSIIVFLSRLVPGIRSLVAFPAGASKMNFTKYFIYTIAGSFCWNVFLTTIGFVAYQNKDAIFAIMKPIENFIVYALIALVLLYIFRVIYQIRKLRKNNLE